MSCLSIEELKSRLSYDPETGVFMRLATASFNPKAQVGKQAGSRDKLGYWYVRVGGKRYMAHRLAWFYVHGEWPAGDIDHINRVAGDNRIENLRVATRSQNMANTRTPAHNSSGTKGVSFDRANGKWLAQMQVDGKAINLGRFDTKAEATKVRQAAFSASFGEFARP